MPPALLGDASLLPRHAGRPASSNCTTPADLKTDLPCYGHSQPCTSSNHYSFWLISRPRRGKNEQICSDLTKRLCRGWAEDCRTDDKALCLVVVWPIQLSTTPAELILFANLSDPQVRLLRESPISWPMEPAEQGHFGRPSVKQRVRLVTYDALHDRLRRPSPKVYAP
jgi:hypothetical protein